MSEGAICPNCQQNMMFCNGCTKGNLHIDSRAFVRIPYGYEGRARYGRDDKGVILEDKRCHDCHCQTKRLHHLGCDVEECPKCHGQLISCGCWRDAGQDSEVVPLIAGPIEVVHSVEFTIRAISLAEPDVTEWVCKVSYRLHGTKQNLAEFGFGSNQMAALTDATNQLIQEANNATVIQHSAPS